MVTLPNRVQTVKSTTSAHSLARNSNASTPTNASQTCDLIQIAANVTTPTHVPALRLYTLDF